MGNRGGEESESFLFFGVTLSCGYTYRDLAKRNYAGVNHWSFGRIIWDPPDIVGRA